MIVKMADRQVNQKTIKSDVGSRHYHELAVWPVIHHVVINIIDNAGGILLAGGPAVNQVGV